MVVGLARQGSFALVLDDVVLIGSQTIHLMVVGEVSSAVS